jgi:hypothetical protein
MAALSYQGIADQIAYVYMEQHGYVRWDDINQKLARRVPCPKLKSYWHFHGCRYQKLSRTCAEPDHIARCSLPTHDLRNGHLNQTAYSLYLFIRDIADGDLIGWIDQRLQAASSPTGPDRLAGMRDALIAPLREIYGVSHKVLAMALSSILLGAPKKLRLWREVGASMIGRYSGSQLSASYRDLASVRRRPCLWFGLLPARRLRRHHSSRGRTARCQRL